MQQKITKTKDNKQLNKQTNNQNKTVKHRHSINNQQNVILLTSSQATILAILTSSISLATAVFTHKCTLNY